MRGSSMLKFCLTRAAGVARVTELLQAIIASDEWDRYSATVAEMDWMDGREAFRQFFDAYDDAPGNEWLGITEWAVTEEMRSLGSAMTFDTATIDRIVTRISRHPNIEMVG